MIEREPDPACEQRDGELVEADALLGRGGDELGMQPSGHTDEDSATGFHGANDSACAIDNSDSACNITGMTTHTRRVLNIRMEVEVDEHTWSTEYGTPIASVEDYLLNQIAQSPAAEAGAITVTGYAVGGL